MTDSDQAVDEKPYYKQGMFWLLIALILTGLTTALITLLVYIFAFPGDIERSHTAFGLFGDYFGGVLNPIIAFLALGALLVTIYLQLKELRLTRNELRTSSKALRDQTMYLDQQTFENTFFKLLEIHAQNLDMMWVGEPTTANVGSRARSCFKYFSDRFQQHYNRANDQGGSTLEIVTSAYEGFFNESKAHLGHYFAHLETIVEFIDGKANIDKEKYISFLAAQLSPLEIKILFYHGLNQSYGERMKELIEKYGLLRDIDSRLLTNPNDQIRLYRASAFSRTR